MNPGSKFLISLFFTICLMAILPSCTNSNKNSNNFSGQFTQIQGRANKELAHNPNEAIRLMDSMVQVVSLEALADTQMVDYFLLKKQHP